MQTTHNSTTTHKPSPPSARVLSNLVEYGYAPADPPDLPPAWQAPFEAVLRLREQGRRIRLEALKSALEDLPHGFPMLEEVLQLSEGLQDRADQHRLLYSAQDALHDPPALEWSVDGFFTLPSFNLIVGPPGAKKTLLAIDLAVSVAAGRPWLDHSVRPSSVLFVDEDTGLHRLWSRLNASLRAHAAGSATPLHFISLGGYDLRHPEDAEALTNRALSVDARLIVIDALPNLMRGAAETNLAAVQPVLFHLRRMSEHCRAAVVAIHHTNKRGAFRGSSAISSSADLMLSIESAPNSDLLTLRTLKARFLAPDPLCAQATFETDANGKDTMHFAPSGDQPDFETPPPTIDPQQGIALAILEYLAAHQTATTRQLTRHLAAYNPASVRNAIHQLIQSSHIHRVNSGARGKKALYALAKPSLRAKRSNLPAN